MPAYADFFRVTAGYVTKKTSAATHCCNTLRQHIAATHYCNTTCVCCLFPFDRLPLDEPSRAALENGILKNEFSQHYVSIQFTTYKEYKFRFLRILTRDIHIYKYLYIFIYIYM